MTKMAQQKKYLAHVKPDTGEVHELADHLHAVKSLAEKFAAHFGNSDWAGLAALWHDLGKYHPDFQKMINVNSGYDPDASLEGKIGRVNHSSAGALHAIRRHAIRRMEKKGRILAYLIAGHHAGLADWHSDASGMSSLEYRLRQSYLLEETLQAHPPDDIVNAQLPTTSPPAGADPALWIRMLFSCLVDADFLDTENFMEGSNKGRGGFQSLNCLLPLLENHLQQLKSWAPDTSVNQVRSQVLEECMQKSSLAPGFFSLTVPTGGGKTLSSMAFAMRHAIEHKLDRVIYVIPYTSIIEQTADVFRNIFGDNVVEHHSNLDPDEESVKSRLASENWDAPIIVTTSVQFFESLFAVRTSRTRKLHNIVNSVVVLDEVQLLPPDFLAPILHVIRDLKQSYRTSFVFCTATQPSLAPHHGPDFHFKGIEGIREIVSDPNQLHASLKRVRVHLPESFSQSVSWNDLAEKLAGYSSVLCVVNTRKDCRDLHKLMPKGTYHLSALMCGEHRSRLIRDIKDKLKTGGSVRVVSTQLVEAGVDVDFPVVYRAMCGLDSIAQAAGRCNREGRLEQGQVHVFVPPGSSPPGHLRQAEQAAREILLGNPEDPLEPRWFEAFFKNFYWIKGDRLDAHHILEDLKPDPEMRFRFRSAAQKFRIVDDAAQAAVIVRFGESPKWIEILKNSGPEKWLMRKLQRYTVSVNLWYLQKMQQAGSVLEIEPGLYVQSFDGLYRNDIGLMVEQPDHHEAEDLIL